jgi:hypothetical protein
MTKRWLFWSALGALLFLGSSIALAQPEGSLRLRLGAYFPADGDLQALNKTWFAVGLTYQTMGIPFFGSTATEVSADLFTHQTGGSRGAITALLVSQVYEQPLGAGDALLQLRLGLGLYVADTTGPSKNIFGGRVGLTLQFNETYSVELNYDITDRFGAGNDRANGFSIAVGYRF